MQRILIVDDDVRHRTLVSNYLAKHSYETLVAANALEMQKQRERFNFQLIVLDVTMPGEDGLSICKKMRDMGDKTPIILLTGRNETVDRLFGFEFGADDYLSKPFDPRELLARVQSVLRRFSNINITAYESINVQVEFGNYLLDGKSRTLLSNNQPINLSSTEFALLITLAGAPGRVFSRNQLATLVTSKGGDLQPNQRNIDNLVSRLRKKLEIKPCQPNYIITEIGRGYAFTTQSVIVSKN